MVKNIFAVLLIIYGVFGNSIFDILDTNVPTPPEPAPVVIEIDTPTPEMVSLVTPIALLVENQEDKIRLAVFSYEFSQRVAKYDEKADLQQMNDIFVSAAKTIFGTELHGKYDGLDEAITKLVTDGVSESINHTLTTKECKELSSRFQALAWAFVQR